LNLSTDLAFFKAFDRKRKEKGDNGCMKLFVLNGSPRGRSSNTRVILDALIEGYLTASEHEIISSDLMLEKGMDNTVRSAAATSDSILIAFPLYVDSMPGIVKEFL